MNQREVLQVLQKIRDLLCRDARFSLFCVFSLMAILVNMISTFHRTISGPLFSYHLYTYELGFVPRALYGSTVGMLTQHFSLNFYHTVWALIMGAAYIMAWLVYVFRRNHCSNTDYIDLLALFAFCLPTMWLPLYDLFRLDIVIFLLFLICAVVCWERNALRFLVPVIMVVMTLTHEAAIFMFLPVLCGIVIYRMRDKSDVILLFWLICGVLASCILFGIASRNTPDVEETKKFLLSRWRYEDIQVSFGGYLDTVAKDNTEHLSILKSHWMRRSWRKIIMRSLPYDLLTIGVIAFFWKKYYSSAGFSSRKEILRFGCLLLSPLSCAGLLFIGCDYNRWFAVFFAVHLFLLAMAYTDRERVVVLPPFSRLGKEAFVLGSVLLFMTQTGDFYSFSAFARQMNEWISLAIVAVVGLAYYFFRHLNDQASLLKVPVKDPGTDQKDGSGSSHAR